MALTSSRQADIVHEANIVWLVDVLRRRWQFIASFFVAGAIVSATIVYMMAPVYRAETVVVPADADNAAGTLARIAGQLGPLSGFLGDFGGSSGVPHKQVWLATMRSRGAMRLFIEEKKLAPVLFADRWDVTTSAWKKGREIPTIHEAVLRFSNSIISIAEDNRNGLITVAIEWRDPVQAAQWANEFVAMTNALIHKRVIEEGERNIRFLEAELQKTSVLERRQIIFRLMESRTNEIMIANGRADYAFAVVDAATAPDSDKYVRPQRLLMTIVGGIAAMLLGALLAAFREWQKKATTAQSIAD